MTTIEWRFSHCASPKAMATAARPQRKAAPLDARPRQAEEHAQRGSETGACRNAEDGGDTRGLRNRCWYAAPAVARAAPTRSAAACGPRMFKMTNSMASLQVFSTRWRRCVKHRDDGSGRDGIRTHGERADKEPQHGQGRASAIRSRAVGRAHAGWRGREDRSITPRHRMG